jgi:hypothetical protein
MHAHRPSAPALLDDGRDDCSRNSLKLPPGAPRARLRAQD